MTDTNKMLMTKADKEEVNERIRDIVERMNTHFRWLAILFFLLPILAVIIIKL